MKSFIIYLFISKWGFKKQKKEEDNFNVKSVLHTLVNGIDYNSYIEAWLLRFLFCSLQFEIVLKLFSFVRLWTENRSKNITNAKNQSSFCLFFVFTIKSWSIVDANDERIESSPSVYKNKTKQKKNGWFRNEETRRLLIYQRFLQQFTNFMTNISKSIVINCYCPIFSEISKRVEIDTWF